MTPILPWQMHPLDRWTIVEMSHYYVAGHEAEQLHVRMERDAHTFSVAGDDTPLIWEEAIRKALELYPEEVPGGRTPLASPWEADRMRVLLGWEAGEISEGTARRLLGLDVVSCRDLLAQAIKAGVEQCKRMPAPKVQPPAADAA